MDKHDYIDKCNFNPRTSCEVRRGQSQQLSRSMHFNPRTSCEVRLQILAVADRPSDFNPRTSCEVRLNTLARKKFVMLFQSTHLV